MCALVDAEVTQHPQTRHTVSLMTREAKARMVKGFYIKALFWAPLKPLQRTHVWRLYVTHNAAFAHGTLSDEQLTRRSSSMFRPDAASNAKSHFWLRQSHGAEMDQTGNDTGGGLADSEALKGLETVAKQLLGNRLQVVPSPHRQSLGMERRPG